MGHYMTMAELYNNHGYGMCIDLRDLSADMWLLEDSTGLLSLSESLEVFRANCLERFSSGVSISRNI